MYNLDAVPTASKMQQDNELEIQVSVPNNLDSTSVSRNIDNIGTCPSR